MPSVRLVPWVRMLLASCPLLLALAASDALAARQPKDFTEPPAMTEEQLAEAKAKSRTPLNRYAIEGENKPAPFPWVFVGMAALSLAVAVPFALRAYLNTVRELGLEENEEPRTRRGAVE